MYKHLFSTTVSALLLAACSPSGGGASDAGAATTGTVRAAAAPASSPSPSAAPGGSRLVFAQSPRHPEDRTEVSGLALAKLHDDGRFVLYVYSNDIDPKPTCENPSPAEKRGAKGSQIGIVIYDFNEKAGKIKAKEALIDRHDANGAPDGVDDLHGPDVDITLYDGKTLKATVVTPDPPGVDIARVDGTIVATVCPHKT